MNNNVPSAAAEFARVAEQLRRERADAAAIVEAVTRNPWAHAREPIPASWITAGLAQELTAAASAPRDGERPRKRLGVALLATRIAAALDQRYPEVMRLQLTAHAWRAVAEAHYSKGDHAEALVALALADRVIHDHHALSFDNAYLQLMLARILHRVGRGREILPQLAEARDVLREHGAESQVAQCDRLRGLIEGSGAWERSG